MINMCIIFGVIIVLMMIFIINIKKNGNIQEYKDLILMESVPIEFETKYQMLYQEYLKELEEARKKARRRRIVQYILLILALCGVAVVALNELNTGIQYNTISKIFVVLMPFNFVMGISLGRNNTRFQVQYKQDYKEKVIRKFIKLINEELTYEPIKRGGNYRYNIMEMYPLTQDKEALRIAAEKKQTMKEFLIEHNSKYLLEEEYRKAKFDNKSFNRYLQDDYIEGYINENVFIKMADLDIKQEYKTGERNRKYIQDVFQGLFAVTNSNKNIKSCINIKRNKFKVLEKNDRVQMDSQEFEKYFDVYSSNKILAMQVLTADVMWLLQEFYSKYNLDFEIIINDDKIYLRFFTGPVFEPKVFGSSMDKELLFTYYCILKFTTEVTEQINKVLNEIEI